MRFAKIFRIGSTRADIGVDLANLLNTNYATTWDNTYQYIDRQHREWRDVEQPDGDLRAAVRAVEFHLGLLDNME